MNAKYHIFGGQCVVSMTDTPSLLDALSDDPTTVYLGLLGQYKIECPSIQNEYADEPQLDVKPFSHHASEKSLPFQVRRPKRRS